MYLSFLQFSSKGYRVPTCYIELFLRVHVKYFQLHCTYMFNHFNPAPILLGVYLSPRRSLLLTQGASEKHHGKDEGSTRPSRSVTQGLLFLIACAVFTVRGAFKLKFWATTEGHDELDADAARVAEVRDVGRFANTRPQAQLRQRGSIGAHLSSPTLPRGIREKRSRYWHGRRSGFTCWCSACALVLHGVRPERKECQQRYSQRPSYREILGLTSHAAVW